MVKEADESDESDGKVVELRSIGSRVKRVGYGRPCRHPQVVLDVSRSMLECESCRQVVNPVWWMNEWLHEVEAAIALRDQAQREEARIKEVVATLKKERDSLRAAIRRLQP